MTRTLSLIIIAGLFVLAGCATKTEPMADTAQTEQMAKPMAKAVEPAHASPKGPAVSGSRAASSQSPVTNTGSLATGFHACIDGIRAFGPVRLGMTIEQVRMAAPWLDIDIDNSASLSAPITTLCGERIWKYMVRFDADCLVSSVRFTGPQRMERVFENTCEGRGEMEDGILTPFKWRCEYDASTFTVVPHERGLNIYTLIGSRVPEREGRCMLPRYWD